MESKFRITEHDSCYQTIDIISKALNRIGLTIVDDEMFGVYIIKDYTPPPSNPDYEYEFCFKSEPGDSIRIDGWMPIATERIKHPEKIDHYIEIGLLRKFQKNSPEN